jgi:hypothetical protein
VARKRDEGVDGHDVITHARKELLAAGLRRTRERLESEINTRLPTETAELPLVGVTQWANLADRPIQLDSDRQFACHISTVVDV